MDLAVTHRIQTGQNLTRLEDAVKAGAYHSLQSALRSSNPEQIIQVVEASGLRGRGGAGFPTGAKWNMVQNAPGDVKYVICNADEGEPGTFKDKLILEKDPHLLLEGIILAGFATGACEGILYLRYEYPKALKILERALKEAKAAGYLGENIQESGFDFNLLLRRGAGAYICGEETSLLNSLEGKRAIPREKPPYPPQAGLFGKPTLINNVETFACVPAILEHGPEWFHDLGLGDKNAGTKIYSLSGDIKTPGNYELPLGITARELLYHHAGGMKAKARPLKAFTMGGLSGGFLTPEHLDMALDFDAPAGHGAMLGSGGIIILDTSRCMVDTVKECNEFFEEESCGKCFPCRLGTHRLSELLKDLTTGQANAETVQAIESISELLAKTSACGLGIGAANPLFCLLRYFSEEVQAHLENRCPASVCAF